jgi:hypothetical protein
LDKKNQIILIDSTGVRKTRSGGSGVKEARGNNPQGVGGFKREKEVAPERSGRTTSSVKKRWEIGEKAVCDAFERPSLFQVAIKMTLKTTTPAPPYQGGELIVPLLF